MSKPYIIVHMMTSIDGRIDCGMTAQLDGNNEYYATLDQLNAPTRVSGRVTAQTEINGGQLDHADGPAYDHERFAKHSDSHEFEIIADTHGKLRWGKENSTSHPHLILTSEDVPADYLKSLDAANICWIAAGKGHIDLKRAMTILGDEFSVDRLAVVGGGKINGGFLSAGVVDEISLLVGPGVDGRSDQPSVFDGFTSSIPTPLNLKAVQSYGDGAVWLRYTTK